MVLLGRPVPGKEPEKGFPQEKKCRLHLPWKLAYRLGAESESRGMVKRSGIKR